MSVNNNPLFELSTERNPDEQEFFTVDGENYNLYRFSDMTPEQAAELRVLIRREQVLTKQIDEGEDRKKLRVAADELNRLRVELLTMMTEMPEEVVKKLRIPQQRQIIDYIANAANSIICEKCQTVNDRDAAFCKGCAVELPGPDETKLIEGHATEVLEEGEAVGSTV